MDLAPYAANSSNSRGRKYPEPAPDNRSEYQRDRDRIIHCAAFRRLEYKTQVFVNHEGDMFRTRLTHSIEVAQISRSVARVLHLNEDLTEAIALAHDLGHTPFGHAGQEVLNDCMREHQGFEHNLQSLRVVDELEEKYAGFPGLNLTFETREGILKHCPLTQARELGKLGERFLTNKQPTLEAQIANIADEIAYNNHDVDDGLRANLLTIEQLNEVQLFKQQYEQVRSLYPHIDIRRTTHEVIRRMINHQITDLLTASQERFQHAAIATITDVRNQRQPLVGFSTTMQEIQRQLKHFLHHNLYRHYRVHRMSAKAKRVIRGLFETFLNDSRLLPPEPFEKVARQEKIDGCTGRARVIADYIAGMTDRYAIIEYERIFNPMQLT